jgi:dynein heavy chain
VTNGKKTQAACEDNILRLLITAEGPLLDNLELIATLDTSKETWEKVNKFNTTMAQTSPQKQTNKQKKNTLILIKMLRPISKDYYYYY